MAQLLEGARVEVQGSGANRYTLEHKGDVYSCTCPAWRNQGVRIELRTCKHLRAYLGDAVETARVGTAMAMATTTASTSAAGRIKARRVSRFVEDPELRDERFAHLQRAVERYPVIDDRMQTVYGLRMPKHLAFAIGFWMGLTDAEREEAWAYVGNGPAGVGEWFLDGMLDRRVMPGLDERLEYRFRCDPPEMVTIFTGNSDGGHWGLWYDDPKELPTTIVQNYARDSAETSPCERTLLQTLREDISGERAGDLYDPAEWPHRTAILAWLDEVLEREIDAYEDQRSYWPGARPNDLIGGMASIDPAWVVPDELVGYNKQQERYAAYKARDPIVKEWIALAMKELVDERSAGRALFIGRELHWIDADEWRAECTDLLVNAYESLDRHALAEIVAVHHRHRDLASVSVYAPPLNAFKIAVSAASTGEEVERITHEIEESGFPSCADLGDALRGLTDLRVLGALLELVPQVPGSESAADRAAAEHVEASKRDSASADDEYPELREIAASRSAAAMRIFERCGARGKAFLYAVESPLPVLRASAITHADLAWRSTRGRSVLHIAAGIPLADAVGRLLDRGADPRARDRDGKTPYDSARNAWERNTREANAIFELLTARGGGPEKPKEEIAAAAAAAAAVEWTAGTTVTHSKFGDGVVETVAGAGEQTKLTIKFASATKVLVAKFVTRK